MSWHVHSYTTSLKYDFRFIEGDNRPSEIPMLTVIHIVFLREHNNIVEGLHKINSHWDGERLYQEAKKILTGIYQHIIYTEYLPIILGPKAMKFFGLNSTPFGHSTSYDIYADPSTRNAFGAAAFRFGHSLVGEFVGSSNQYLQPKALEALEDHFFRTQLVRDKKIFGPDGIGRWMTSQFKSASDQFLTPAIRNRLFQTKPGNGFDLSALNIQRGRDHGIPGYNRWRQFCGFEPAYHFKVGKLGLLDHSPKTAKALLSVYKYVYVDSLLLSFKLYLFFFTCNFNAAERLLLETHVHHFEI